MLANMFRRFISWIGSWLADLWNALKPTPKKPALPDTASPKKDGTAPVVLPAELPVDPDAKQKP